MSTGLTAIADFKDLHKGKRLFILASGPSLNDHDLAPLSRRIVMGLNRSFMIFPEPQYHCCMDQRLFDLYPRELRAARYLFTLGGIPWGIPIKLLGGEGFSHDLEVGVYSGYTISYLALQVAAYLGFAEIVYLGLDLKLRQGNTHFFGQDFYSRNHEQTEFPKMKRMLEYGATMFPGRVFTCSPETPLAGFSSISFADAIAR